MSYCTLVIGKRGEGKTTFIKSAIKAKPNYVFDVQDEYGDFNPAPHLDRERFVEECMGYIDTYCVFEEATGFFQGRLSLNVDRMMLSARHSRNRYFFCFHTIQAVPPQIINMCNYAVLFKTGDQQYDVIRKKYPLLWQAWVEVMDKRKPKYSKKIIQLQ